MACGGSVRTTVGAVVVGEMMRLVHWLTNEPTDALVDNVLLSKYRHEAHLEAEVEHI